MKAKSQNVDVFDPTKTRFPLVPPIHTTPLTPAGSDRPDNPARSQTSPVHPGSRLGDPVEVVIVDDNPSERLLTERTVAKSDQFRRIASFGSGEEALESETMARTRVVLMDVQMPGMSGIACTRLLKQRLPDLVIVMLTGSEDPELLREAVAAGANGYLSKPLTSGQCSSAIELALGGGFPLANRMRNALSALRPNARELSG
jgi:DNA-binding NarL/FixJ family response regulator